MSINSRGRSGQRSGLLAEQGLDLDAENLGERAHLAGTRLAGAGFHLRDAAGVAVADALGKLGLRQIGGIAGAKQTGTEIGGHGLYPFALLLSMNQFYHSSIVCQAEK